MKFNQIKKWCLQVKEYLVSQYYLTLYKKRLARERLQILSGLIDKNDSLWKYVINNKKAKSLLTIISDIDKKTNANTIPDALIIRSDQEIAKLYKDKIVSRDSEVIERDDSISVDLGELSQRELIEQAIDTDKSPRNID